MRLKRLILWDIKFQTRYGFYLLYAVLTVLYVVIIFSLPETWKSVCTAMLIFSDPAAMGLFFMGAVVLLEKSQRVHCALSVSPAKADEYIISKIFSFGAIALLVATMLVALAMGIGSLFYVLPGTVLANTVFTLFGIIISSRITSLNQFILCTVPIEIFAFVPAILHLFNLSPAVLRSYPANVCMDMISGKSFSIIGLLYTVILIIVLYIQARKCILKMWQGAGGVKL